jgi:(1->4)-alpha-D-glucan 1-alpha-D-glucosylmutase
MLKALREAKIHSSWINPNGQYEKAVDEFIGASLSRSADNPFLSEAVAFISRIKAAGMWNSLSQVLLKVVSPGVPDFYQGNELWDFSLVDPDNRRPVDYALRRQLLNKLQNDAHAAVPLIEELVRNPADGAIKLHLTARALCFRKSHSELLAKGAYMPLRAAGNRQNHVIAFARKLKDDSAIAVAGRFFMGLGASDSLPIGEETWGDSALVLRRDLSHLAYREVFSQTTIETAQQNGRTVLPLAKAFSQLPVALLYGIE